MKGFIDDGALKRAIEQRDFFPRAFMKYVSFRNTDGVLRVLLGGDCPVCEASHMRNICNQKYSNEVISPIMRLVFPIINLVKVVRSTDADLEAVVWAHNGRILNPYRADVWISFLSLNKFCLDLHPDIDGYIKSLTPVAGNGIVNRGEASRNDFTDKNYLCWTIMDSTCCVSRAGEVLQGETEIMVNEDDLPHSVSIFAQEQGSETRQMMLGSTGRINFGTDKYKILDFGNI